MPRSSMLSDAATGYLRYAVFLAVFFVLTPWMLEVYGPQQFGLWTLAFSLLGILGLADFGLAAGAVREVAGCRGRADAQALEEVVSTVLLLSTSAAVLAASVLAVSGSAVLAALDVPHAHRGQALWLLWVLGARFVILGLPLGVARAVLYGGGHVAAVNLVNVGSCLAYGVMASVVLALRLDLWALAAANLAAMLLEHVAYLILVRRRVPTLRVRWAAVRAERAGELLRFGGCQLLIQLAGLLVLRADPVVVKLQLPLEAVGLYAVGGKLAEHLQLLVRQGINVVAPRVAAAQAVGDRRRLRALFLSLLRVATLAGAVPIGMLAGVAPDLLGAWAGPYYSAAGGVLRILLASAVLAIPVEVAGVFLGMGGHHQAAARFAITGAVVNVVASLALAQVLGLPGVALGTLVTTILVGGGGSVRRALRWLEIPPRAFCVAVGGGVPVLVSTGAVAALPLGASLAGLAVRLVAALVVAGVMLLRQATTEERVALARGFDRLRRLGLRTLRSAAVAAGFSGCDVL